MLVIIFHPTDELKLIRFQKEFQKKEPFINSIKGFPLWANLNCNDEELKAFSKTIISVKFNSILQKDSTLILQYIIKTDDSEITADLPLFHDCPPDADKLFDIKKIPATEIKIFRLGICIKNDETHSKEIEDSVWVKLT